MEAKSGHVQKLILFHNESTLPRVFILPHIHLHLPQEAKGVTAGVLGEGGVENKPAALPSVGRDE